MNVFNKEMYHQKLSEYYRSVWGEQADDFFYQQPAVNVWVFRRAEQIITLKSHILTGEVSETTEPKRRG